MKYKVTDHVVMKLWPRQEHVQPAAERLRRKHMRTKPLATEGTPECRRCSRQTAGVCPRLSSPENDPGQL